MQRRKAAAPAARWGLTWFPESSAPFLFPPTSFLLLSSLPTFPPPPLLPSPDKQLRETKSARALLSPAPGQRHLGPGHPGFPGSASPPQPPPPPALARSLARSLPARCLPHLRSAGRKAAGAQDGFSRALRPARLLLGAGDGAGHGRRRRGSFQGVGVQAQEHHGVGAALPARERPEHHAQPLGLRTQAPLLRTQRLPGRNGRGGRPGEHRAALLRVGWVPGEVEAARGAGPAPPAPPLWLALHTHSPTTSPPPPYLPGSAPYPDHSPSRPTGGRFSAPDFSPESDPDAGPPTSPALPWPPRNRLPESLWNGPRLSFISTRTGALLGCSQFNSQKPFSCSQATSSVLGFKPPGPPLLPPASPGGS